MVSWQCRVVLAEQASRAKPYRAPAPSRAQARLPRPDRLERGRRDLLHLRAEQAVVPRQAPAVGREGEVDLQPDQRAVLRRAEDGRRAVHAWTDRNGSAAEGAARRPRNT